MVVRLWVFLSVIAVVKAYGSSDLVLDVLSVISGKWDNRAGVQAGLTNNLLNFRFVPMDLPAFRPKTMAYFEFAINETVLMFLCEVKEDTSSKKAVLLISYVFNNGIKYKAGEFDLGDLYHVTPDVLTSVTQCTSKFETSANGTVSAPCPQCNDEMNQPHPMCQLTFLCDTVTLDRPASAAQIGKPLNDVFHLNGPSVEIPSASCNICIIFSHESGAFQYKFNGGIMYPLVHVPKGYVSPCDKKNRTSTNNKCAVREAVNQY